MGKSKSESRKPFDRAAGLLEVVPRRIEELKLDPRNPRNHRDKQEEQIARSLDTFGFVVPVLVDANLRVLAGHGRIQAARRLGWTTVPTIRIEHLSEAQARGFQIADNKLCENGQWNDRLLAEQLSELSSMDIDFELEVTGFEAPEIEFLIDSLTTSSGENDSADAIPPHIETPGICKEGDLWLLGKNRVLNGDALTRSALEILMNGEKADAVFDDPPYNVRIPNNVSGLGRICHRDFRMASGEMSRAQFTEFLTSTFSLQAEFSREGSIHYQCIDWRHVEEMSVAGRAAYDEHLNVCTWIKHNAGMGSFYRSGHEFIFVFKKGKAKHTNNVMLGKFGRNRSNVWSYPGANSFSRNSVEANLLELHPCVKPVALIADAIRDCSARGALILDAFLGSGSTIIAAERTGRRCFGLEIDPVYIDRLIRRWQKFTGGSAIHALSGRRFDEIEKEAVNHD